MSSGKTKTKVNVISNRVAVEATRMVNTTYGLHHRIQVATSLDAVNDTITNIMDETYSKLYEDIWP